MFKRALLLNVVAAVALSMTGCGSSPTAADTSGLDDTGYTSDPGTGYTSDPNAGASTGYGTTTGTNGYGTTTGVAAAPLADLTATVTTKKNGSFLGMGAFTCTVEVSNPNSVARTGTLTVTFKNGSKDSKTAPTVQQISLAPNETRSLDFKDTAWSTDAVDAEITSDPVQSTAAASSYGSSYGATTSAYGTTSSYPTGY